MFYLSDDKKRLFNLNALNYVQFKKTDEVAIFATQSNPRREGFSKTIKATVFDFERLEEALQNCPDMIPAARENSEDNIIYINGLSLSAIIPYEGETDFHFIDGSETVKPVANIDLKDLAQKIAQATRQKLSM